MHHFSQLAVIGLLLFWMSTMPASAAAPILEADFASVNPAFTYQGELRHNADPVNGLCNFQFALFDAATNGTQLGNAQNADAVNVTDGLFMVQLNGNSEFGANAFDGNPRWLQIAVQCETDATLVTLARQPLTASPYALFAAKANKATSAATAISAITAISATVATSALTALSATTAVSATTADRALNAIHATTATSATVATSARTAISATTAGSALTAGSAITALNATTAESANTALSTAALQGRTVSPVAPDSGQILKWNGSAWAPDNDLVSSGTITSVTAGAGLSGGGVRGNVAISINVPLALNGAALNGNAVIVANNTASQGVGLYGIGAFEGVKGIANANDVSYGVYGESRSIFSNGAGVYGYAVNGYGVLGKSTASTGVTGQGVTGVIGLSTSGNASGSLGTETRGVGIGVTGHASGFGVSAESYGGGVALAAIATGASNATTLILGCQDYYCPGNTRVFRVDYTGRGYFNGGTQSSGADVAEFIPSQENLQPGDVVEIDPDYPDQFRRTTTPNSLAVAGVISTAPGVTLGAQNAANGTEQGPQLALIGRVPVKVSVENGSIHPGDLLVSSMIPGHAMKAGANPAVGTVIGKALGTLNKGTGSLLMLVMLR